MRWAAFVVVLASVALGAAAHLVPDEADFPFTPVANNIAGAPGSAGEARNLNGGEAHATTTDGAGDADCEEMDDKTQADDGEAVVTPAIEEGEFFEPEPSSEFDTFDLRCNATHRFARINPTSRAPAVPFLLSRAVETVGTTACVCKCSGHNGDCGAPGKSVNFHNVTSEVECAQLICHVQKFGSCLWNDEEVAKGQWRQNVVAFNSPVLIEAPSASPSYSPSPSPSPSSPPSRDGLTNIKTIQLLADMGRRMCFNISSSLSSRLLPSLGQQLEMLPLPLAEFPNVCNGLPEPVAPTYAAEGASPTIENALAGYSGASPLAADLARYAAFGMDKNVAEAADLLEDNMLLQGSNADRLQADATDKLTFLFINNVAKEKQCDVGMPAMHDIVRFGLRIQDPCIAQISTANIRSLAQFLSLVFDELKLKTQHKDESVSPSPSPSPAELEPIAEPENPVDEPGSAESESVDNSMTLQSRSCVDGEDFAAHQFSDSANEIEVEDTQGRAPGSRSLEGKHDAPAVNMPEFGAHAAVEMIWAADANQQQAKVATKPPPPKLYAENHHAQSNE